MERLVALLGLGVFIGFAYLTSTNRSAIRWRTILWGFALQIIFALFILRTPLGLAMFQAVGNVITAFLNYSDAGASFVFGEDFESSFIAFKVLPTIIFFSAFISLLYHYKILQWIVGAIAKLMMLTMKTTGPETLSAAGNIFVGQTEAPLLVKPYIEKMTRSELHAIMTGGFATIAGSVLAAYISLGIPAEHLMSASVMSAPAALAFSKLMYPETENPAPPNRAISPPPDRPVTPVVERAYNNALDAITTGTIDGLKLALNVGAMLIAFLALVAAANGGISFIGGIFGYPDLTLESIFAFFLSPVAWLMGIPWADCSAVGALLGKKTILNEFIAYTDLQVLIQDEVISQRAQIIATYALCGFANLGSIGIQIGGLSALAPNRQKDLADLSIRAMIAGTLACFCTACIAGILL